MNKYTEHISKMTVLDEIKHTPFYDNRDKKTMIEMVLSIPASNLTPIIRSEWDFCCEYNHRKYYRCKHCDYAYEIFENTNYCQHCGALVSKENIQEIKK